MFTVCGTPASVLDINFAQQIIEIACILKRYLLGWDRNSLFNKYRKKTLCDSEEATKKSCLKPKR